MLRRIVLIATFFSAFSSDGQARFLQTDPVGYQDDLNAYLYTHDDPVNRTDPSGKWECNTCDAGQRRKFETSKSGVILHLDSDIKVLKILQAKLAKHEKLSDAEMKAAALMDKYLGSGAGHSEEAVTALLEYATGIMSVMKNGDQMVPGNASGEADMLFGGGGPNTDLLNDGRNGFFSKSDTDRQQTMVHESARAANYSFNSGSTFYDSATGADGRSLPASGRDNIAKLAGSGTRTWQEMLYSFLDASVSALGF